MVSYTLLLASAAAIAHTHALPNAKTATLTERQGVNGTDTQFKLALCLQAFANMDWTDGFDCEGIAVFNFNRQAWDSPSDCYNACAGPVREDIDNGLTYAYCDTWAFAAHCWLGYEMYSS